MKNLCYRPTWAEINLANIAYNYRQVKNKVGRAVKVMAAVKADAYGHGLVPVARKLASCGVDYLGVASIDEGIILREAKIKTPILVLGLPLKNDISPLFKYNLTQTVCDKELALALNNYARSKGKKIKAHIKVDTGMGRIGVLYKQALKFIKAVIGMRYIDIEGVFTHFPCADTNKGFTEYQIGIFRELLSGLEKTGIHIPLAHAANSLGIVEYPESHFNMVRPGLAVYGIYPKPGPDIKLKPALTLKTKVVFVKEVPKGWGISYGHIYVTERRTRIITLPIGYGDGYPRNLSSNGPVLVGGRRLSISGTVCMDQIMVDVGGMPVKPGDEAVLIGSQGRNNIFMEEVAKLAGTIPYEIVCGLGSRIPRLYT